MKKTEMQEPATAAVNKESSSPPPELTLRQIWKDFNHTTTCHGFKPINFARGWLNIILIFKYFLNWINVTISLGYNTCRYPIRILKVDSSIDHLLLKNIV